MRLLSAEPNHTPESCQRGITAGIQADDIPFQDVARSSAAQDDPSSWFPEIKLPVPVSGPPIVLSALAC